MLVLGAQKNGLIEMDLLDTHNMRLGREMRLFLITHSYLEAWTQGYKSFFHAQLD